MRGRWMTMVAAAMVLAGCGTQGTFTGTYAAVAGGSANQVASVGKAFHQVFQAEPFGWTEVSRAASVTAVGKATLPLGPAGQEETVTNVLVQDLAARPIGFGQTEFVGQAQFEGVRPANSFVAHSKVLPFKMTLDQRGKLVRFDFKNVSLSGVKIVRPVFKPVDADEVKAIEAEVLAFVKADPKTAIEPDNNLFSAMVGRSKRFKATIVGTKATEGAFGGFGQAIELKVDMRHLTLNAQVAVFTVTALKDKSGKLIVVQ
jgi:hypothetical protein